MLAALSGRLQSSPLRHDLGEVLGPETESTVDGKPYGITATVGVLMTRLTSRLTSRFFEVFWGSMILNPRKMGNIIWGSRIFNDQCFHDLPWIKFFRPHGTARCSSLFIPPNPRKMLRSIDFSLHIILMINHMVYHH